MRMLFVVPLLGFMSFSLAAFVPQSVDTSRLGMVYGHFSSAQPLDRVELTPIGGLRSPSARVLPNGDFYVADLPPGQYVISRVRVGDTWHALASDRGVRAFTVDAEAGMISYAGSWELAPEQGTITVTVSGKPAPDVLLKRLRYSLRGTGWEKHIP